MIRFACPGCGASYSVDDKKAGKSGKCPKCASQFQIPEAGSSGASPDAFPAPPPPPSSTGGTVEIDPCPGCQARLSVGASDVGIDVECPYCKTVYRATRSGDRPSSPPPSSPMRFDDDEPAPRPSSRRGRDDDDRPRRRDEDEDRPSGRRARSDDDDDRPSRRRRSRDDDDEDDDDRPRRRRRSSGGEGGGDGAATAGMILGLIGLVAWLCPLLGFIIGGLAIKYGSQAKTESGGEKGAAGVIMGWICLALSLLNCLAGVAMNAGK